MMKLMSYRDRRNLFVSLLFFIIYDFYKKTVHGPVLCSLQKSQVNVKQTQTHEHSCKFEKTRKLTFRINCHFKPTASDL